MSIDQVTPTSNCFVVEQAYPSQDQGHCGPQAKRRRISLNEVENELRAAGLSQPALSFLQDLPTSDCANEDMKMSKRPLDGTEDFRAMKRHRACSHCVPGLVTSSAPMVGQTDDAHFLAVVPYRCPMPNGMPSSILPCSSEDDMLHLRLSNGLKQFAVDPLGVVFEVYERGYLLAKLPIDWRPIVTSANRLAKVCTIALDPKGTAYLLSETGELLLTVSAVRYLEGCSCKEELKLEFFDTKVGVGAPLSPASTFAASPSVEDTTEDDADMDWVNI